MSGNMQTNRKSGDRHLGRNEVDGARFRLGGFRTAAWHFPR